MPKTRLLQPKRADLPDTLSRRVREKHRFSQAELAIILGCSPKTIEKWEAQGGEPSDKFQIQLERLAAQPPDPAPALPLSPDEVVAVLIRAGNNFVIRARRAGDAPFAREVEGIFGDNTPESNTQLTLFAAMLPSKRGRPRKNAPEPE